MLFAGGELFLAGATALALALGISWMVGSNIFNVLVVLGLSAAIVPLRLQSRLVRRDVPLLLVFLVAQMIRWRSWIQRSRAA